MMTNTCDTYDYKYSLMSQRVMNNNNVIIFAYDIIDIWFIFCSEKWSIPFVKWYIVHIRL